MPTTIDLPPVPGSTLPTVTITDNLMGTANSATGSVAYSLVFTDAVTGLEVNDFTVTNGTVSTVTGSGTNWVVSVTPATGVASGTIGLTLKASAVVDVAGVANASAVNSSQALDTLAPSASSFNPIADAASVAVGSNIVVTFSEAVQSGIGNIVLKTMSGVTLATYVPGSSNLSIAGNSLTINPTADLAFGTGYKVEFAANSIKDLAGNNYAGITSYGFTTAAFVNTLPSGSVTITGTASRDQTLTASNSLTDVDGLGPITYQWKANGSNIAGATANTYKLTQSEVGKTITVSASYTDAMGTAESVNSTATSAVTAFNLNPAVTPSPATHRGA